MWSRAGRRGRRPRYVTVRNGMYAGRRGRRPRARDERGPAPPRRLRPRRAHAGDFIVTSGRFHFRFRFRFRLRLWLRLRLCLRFHSMTSRRRRRSWPRRRIILHGILLHGHSCITVSSIPMPLALSQAPPQLAKASRAELYLTRWLWRSTLSEVTYVTVCNGM